MLIYPLSTELVVSGPVSCTSNAVELMETSVGARGRAAAARPKKRVISLQGVPGSQYRSTRHVRRQRGGDESRLSSIATPHQ